MKYDIKTTKSTKRNKIRNWTFIYTKKFEQ